MTALGFKLPVHYLVRDGIFWVQCKILINSETSWVKIDICIYSWRTICFHLEIDYAHTLRKPIVPIIIDVDFVPDGWLKELVNEVQTFDFSRRSMFAGSLDALTEHVKSVCSPGSMNGATVLNEESKIDNFPYKIKWSKLFWAKSPKKQSVKVYFW